MIIRKYRNGKLINDPIIAPERDTTILTPDNVKPYIKKASRVTRTIIKRKKGCGCKK